MSKRIFVWLLRLYPRSFREEYGVAMQQLFADRLQAEQKLFERVRLWMDITADTVRSATREHRKARGPADGGYSLSDGAIREIARRGHGGGLLLAALSIVLGLALALYGEAPAWPAGAVYGLLFMLVLVSTIGRCAMRRHWRAYSVRVSDEGIEEFSCSRVVRRMRRLDVVGVMEDPRLGMAVQGREGKQSIWIPSLVTGYDEIRGVLCTWAPVQEMIDQHRQAAPPQWAIAVFPPFYGTAMLVREPTLGIALAVVTAALLLVGLLSRNRNHSTARKPSPFIGILLAGLAIKAVFLWRMAP